MGNIYINKVYSFGNLSGTGTFYGLIGAYWEPSLVYTTNSFWDTETSGQSTSVGGLGKTTAEMKTQSTFTDWDFSTVWAINPTINEGYPYLRNNPPR